MKKLLLIILSLMSISIVSANEDAPGKPLAIDTVLQAPNLTADQIYGNIKTWFVQNFRSANDVIQLDDVVNRHLMGRACVDFNVKNFKWGYQSGVIWFNLDIAARDGRYRVKLTDFEHQSNTEGWSEGLVYTGGPNPNVRKNRKDSNLEMQMRAVPFCTAQIASMLASLQNVMSGSNSLDDDW